MSTKRTLILICTILFGIGFFQLGLLGHANTALAAGPWYVTTTGNDGNDCLSPTTPCATINGAIGKATGGDTVYVAEGEYTGIGGNVVIIDKDITLSGGWDEPFTTQDGTSQTDGEGVRNCISVDLYVTANIDHFKVQGGVGGIWNGGVLTLTNSIVRFNESPDGPGGGIFGGYGASTTIIDSQIYANEAAEDGGGIYLDNSDLTLIRSWVVGNAATGNDGGGIQIDGDSSAYIENSIIAGNFTNGNGGGIRNGPYVIVNSNIVGNEANEGAAIDGHYDEVVAINTLIISNTGENGIHTDIGSVITLDHCDTYGNSPDEGDGTITRNNCLGTPPEDGLDPMMAGGPLPAGTGPDYAEEWMGYDFHLLEGSPAIDTGTPDGAPETDIEGNPRDASPDMGAYEWVEGVCPSEIALEGATSEIELNTLRRFRDQVMAGNPAGEAYIRTYYRHAPELSALLLKNRSLRLETARLIRTFMPGVRGLIGEDGGVEMVLTRVRAAQIKHLLDGFSVGASPELRAELASLRIKVDQYQGLTLRQIWHAEIQALK